MSRSGAVDTLRAWANEPGLSGFSALPRLRQAPALYASALANVQQHDFDAARRHVARLAALVADDARAARLARLHRPVRIWQGRDDTWTPPQMAEALARALPDVRSLTWLDGLSHYSTLQQALPRILGPDLSPR